MKVFICVHEWCLDTESGYDIIEVFSHKLNAYACVNTSANDVMREKDHEGIDYNIEYGDNAIIIQYDAILGESFYVLEKEVL